MSRQDALKTSWRRVENILKTHDQDVLKTSWRRKAKPNIFVLIKTSWRRLHQDECLLGYLTFSQLVILTVINIMVTVGNDVIVNTLVIYILIKTKQLSNVGCKVILACQTCWQEKFPNVYFSQYFTIQGLVTRNVSTFSTQLPGYASAILGVDRFIRIKCYVKKHIDITIYIDITFYRMSYRPS